jgi:predicted metal-dependent peptidase
MPGAPKLKGVRKYAPNAVVIIDTSGSMTKQCKIKCLQVVAQGLQSVGEFPVICGDTRVTSDCKVSHLKDQFEMPGGGGTDMTVLIEYAEKKYKPDVIVIGTDGGTPWPDKTKAQLIIALTQEVETPKWATRVRIPDDPRKDCL